MQIDLIIFSSPLHDGVSVMESRSRFFDRLREFSDLSIIDHTELREVEPQEETPLTICFIATGGSEELFLRALPYIPKPVIILSDGYHNSLAASFEIVSYLTREGIDNELIHISPDENDWDRIRNTLGMFHIKQIMYSGKSGDSSKDTTANEYIYSPEAISYLEGANIGLIGGKSSWLISSDIEREYIEGRFGVRFIDIDIEELLEEYNNLPAMGGVDQQDMESAERMYRALKTLCDKYNLKAFTIKCFSLLESCEVTSCLALSKLNDEGIIAGCEGDIPTLWSMMLIYAETGSSPFMANPSSISFTEKSIDFAHCTIPLSMTQSHRITTHFESGKSVAIEGVVSTGEYKIFKCGGPRLDQFMVSYGEIIDNPRVPQRCRTQIRFRCKDQSDLDRFFENRLGNHIVITSITHNS